MKVLQSLLVAWVLCQGASSQQSPAAAPLTLHEVLDLVRSRNQTLRSAQTHVDAVKANEITSGLRPNPVFSSLNEDFNVFDPSHFDPTTDTTQNVSFLLERGGKRKYRLESARLTSTVAEDALRDSGRQLLFLVKQSFVNMLLAKSNQTLAQDNLSDYAKTVELNEIRWKAGDISRTDFDRIKLQQIRFENDLLNAQVVLAQSRTQLQSLMGNASFSPQFDVQGTLDPPDVPFDLGHLQEEALRSRPDYLAALDTLRKAEADVRLADANGATDIVFGTEYKRSGTINNLGFTASVPLRIFDRNQGEKLRTRREVEASKLALEAQKNQVFADVDQAFQAYEAALKRAQLYQSDYVQRARDVRERVQFSYRNGSTSLLDYMDALRDSRDTELSWRVADSQVWTALHQLSFVTGTELIP